MTTCSDTGLGEAGLHLSRRRLLAGLAAGAGASIAPRWTAHASAAGATGGHTLVVVFLRGGPDGCSILVPAGDATYHDRRPGIALDEPEVIPVDTTFGLHPAMAPLTPLLADGHLAVVPACGSTLATRSHFDQQAHIERGGIAAPVDGGAGWLGRLLATSAPGGDDTGFRAIAMGGEVPPSLAGSDAVLAVDGLDAVGPPAFPGLVRDGIDTALRRLPATTGPAMVVTAGVGALDAIPVLLDAAARTGGSAANGTDDPAGLFGSEPVEKTFRDLARLIRADIGIDVATVDIGGWDTHADMGDAEAGRMTALVGTLAAALAAFADEAGDAIVRTTVLAMGEFGRRVVENGSGGTDHGRGGVVLALGGRVRGGRHGEWPGLSADVLDEGDVPVATDWRTVAAEVLEGPHRLGDVTEVLPGVGADRLGIVTA